MIIDKKYFVFDFDGVIVDSVDIKTNAFRKIFNKYDKAIYDKIIDHHIKNGGISRFVKFNLYFNQYLKLKYSQKKINHEIFKFSKEVKKKVIKSKEISGAYKMLKLCIKNNKKLIINTGTPTDEIKYILKKKKYFDFFTLIMGSPTTKEENFFKIKKTFNINYSDMIYFGDSKTDLDVANKLSLDFIGINYNSKKINKIKYYKNFNELLDKVNIV